jgi:TP901 family phage tail tape measure protein
MPSRNTIEIIINAKDNASRVLSDLAGNTQTIGAIATGAIVAGFGAATVAVADFASRGIQEFMVFEQGMQEVFSLLPGISQDAMDKMTDQVERLSQRFGVLPEKTIPAMYEALSAGIPQDNVFKFLETANKAAIAGVTDLETAVNGISSAMNAYGHDVLDAGKASDIMFQTVKLGKTTFEELSNSLYNVSPTAAALGVSFEDLNAQIAAITAQGTPTSVATNQMRQMFVELSKAGGETAETFQQLAGKTFKQFIAEGGNTQDALQLLEQYAQSTGVGINDLFGSVEAGAAALSLTGKNTERFSDFLNQMAEASGSTEAAFTTMSKSLQFQVNRTNAKMSVLFKTIGEKLAPVVAPLVELFGDVVSILIDVVDGTTDFTDAIQESNPVFAGILQTVLDFSLGIRKLVTNIGRFIGALKAGVDPANALFTLLMDLGADTNTGLGIMRIIDFVVRLKDELLKIIQPITDWIRDNVKLQDVLMAIGIAIGSFVIPAIISIGAALAPIIGTFALLVAGVTLLRMAWENDFLGIQTFVVQKLVPALQLLTQWFTEDALPKIIAFVEGVALPALQSFFDWLGGVWETVAPKLGELFNWFITDALPKIVAFVTETVIPKIGEFVTTLINIWNAVSPELGKLFNWFVTDGLPKIRDFIVNEIIPRIGELVTTLVNIWTTVSPELEKLFNWFVSDALPKVRDFILNDVIPNVQKFIDLLKNIWATISPELGKLADWFIKDGLPGVVTFITESFIPTIEKIVTLFAENSGLRTGVAAFIGLLAFGGGGTGLATLLTNVAGAMQALFAKAFAVVGPIGLIAIAILGLVDAINQFNTVTQEAAKNAGQGLASSIQGGLTREQIEAETFRQAQGQFGDLGARLIFGSGIVNIQGKIDEIYNTGKNYGRNLSEGIVQGTTENQQLASDAVGAMGLSMTDRLATDLGIQSPSTVFAEFGRNIVQGLVNGLTEAVPMITEIMMQVSEVMLSNANKIVATITQGWTMIVTVLTKTTPLIVAQLNIMGITLTKLTAIVLAASVALSSFNALGGQSAMGKTQPSSNTYLGFANGIGYVPNTMPAILHKGERVLTADENQNYSNGSPSTVNNYNLSFPNARNQYEADENTKLYVNALRSQGVDI